LSQRRGRDFARVLSFLIYWQATDANMRKAGIVHALFFAFKMFQDDQVPVDCQIRSVIHFLKARNMKSADIHCQICEVHSENAVSDGMVRKWFRKFNKSRDSMHDRPLSIWPCVVSGVFTGGQVLRGGDTETGAVV
jgi:hypothetical protein